MPGEKDTGEKHVSEEEGGRGKDSRGYFPPDLIILTRERGQSAKLAQEVLGVEPRASCAEVLALSTHSASLW